MSLRGGAGARREPAADLEAGAPVTRAQVHQVVSTLVDGLMSLSDPSPRSSLRLGTVSSAQLAAGSASDCSGSDAFPSGATDDLEGTALLKAQYQSDSYCGDEVRPFFADGADGAAAPPAPADDDRLPIPAHLVKRTRIDWISLAVFALFCAALVGYVGIRAWKTMGTGAEFWYGVVVLSIEAVTGLATVSYGLCLVNRVVDEDEGDEEDDDVERETEEGRRAPAGAKAGRPVPAALDYRLRVVITCYKEPLEVVSRTVLAALAADLPPNCTRTVYLLDDGREEDRRRFLRSLGNPSTVYVSGRKRSKGEVNGKSGNVNNAMRQLYPAGVPIPLEEVICLLDADQAPNADFFTKMVPLLDGGRDVAMALSPQTAHNVNLNGDIFNHANVHFWNYSQPGYDALGVLSCTGTNFLLRARAFSDVGWFPEWTLTEDFAMGIELMRRGWRCRYHEGCLAVGEAPEEVRNCFQQRSRWAKGHFQVFFNRKHNPTFGPGAAGLSPLTRFMLGSVMLSYFSTMLAIPLLMLVPLIMVWFGAFPIVLNFWAALSITGYYAATMLILYRCKSSKHLKSMWFTSSSNSILWFAFVKAMVRTTLGSWLSSKIVFKSTAKGRSRLTTLPLGDLWMPILLFTTCLVTFIAGIVHYFDTGNVGSTLPLSLCLIFVNMVPQYLLLQYAAYRKRTFFSVVCRLAMVLSTVAMMVGVVLLWVLCPKTYDYKTTLHSSLFFIDSQRVGTLPDDFRVRWRQSAFLNENATDVYVLRKRNTTACPQWAQVLAGSLVYGLDVAPAPAPASAAPADPAAGKGARNLLDVTVNGEDWLAQVAAATSTTNKFSDFERQSVTSQATQIAFQQFVDEQVALIMDPLCQEERNASGYDPALVVTDPWDLSGGYITGMSAGNIKVTAPMAFTTTMLSWGWLSYPESFEEAGQTAELRDAVRWGADYLARVWQPHPELNASLLVTRVGDVLSEAVLWYPPENSTDTVGQRQAVAVDMQTYSQGGDLGGSVAASLASASIVMATGGDAADLERAASLLAVAKDVYTASLTAIGHFSGPDANMTLIYNSTSTYDDLAWGAAWLYKATKNESYKADVYQLYEKHLEARGAAEEASRDSAYMFDWDNLFWPLNVLLARETGDPAFRVQSERFLDSWVCQHRAADYSTRGRASNPESSTTGVTANAAFAAMVHADFIAAERPSQAAAYKCWGMGQVRMLLGDAGASRVVGMDATSPTRTQDRAAACPAWPATCNRVSAFLSPEPDHYQLWGALVRGPVANTDTFVDDRSSQDSQVGIENNAGWTGALAAAVQVPQGTWDRCLQYNGMLRASPVCGTSFQL